MVNDENQRVGTKTSTRGRTSERFPFSPMNKTSSLLKTIRDNVQIDDTNKTTKAAPSATKRSILASPPPSKTADAPGVLSPPSKNLLSPIGNKRRSQAQYDISANKEQKVDGTIVGSVRNWAGNLRLSMPGPDVKSPQHPNRLNIVDKLSSSDAKLPERPTHWLKQPLADVQPMQLDEYRPFVNSMAAPAPVEPTATMSRPVPAHSDVAAPSPTNMDASPPSFEPRMEQQQQQQHKQQTRRMLRTAAVATISILAAVTSLATYSPIASNTCNLQGSSALRASPPLWSADVEDVIYSGRLVGSGSLGQGSIVLVTDQGEVFAYGKGELDATAAPFHLSPCAVLDNPSGSFRAPGELGKLCSIIPLVDTTDGSLASPHKEYLACSATRAENLRLALALQSVSRNVATGSLGYTCGSACDSAWGTHCVTSMVKDFFGNIFQGNAV